MADQTRTTYLYSFARKLSSILFGLAATVALNRSLGAGLRGEYALIESFILTAAIVFQFGISAIFPNYYRKFGALIKPVFFGTFFRQFSLYLAAGITAGFLFQSVDILVWSLVLATAVYSSQLGQFLIVTDFRAAMLGTVLSGAANAALLLSMLFADAGSVRLAFIILIAKNSILIIYSVYRVLPTLPRDSEKPVGYLFLLRQGLIPMFVNVLIVLNYRLDVMMLGALKVSRFDIGLYAVSLQLIQYAWIIPDIFKDVVHRFTAETDWTDGVAKACRFASTSVLVLIAGVVAFAKPILELLFGADYRGGATTLIILAVGVWSMIYTKLLGTLWLARGGWNYYLKIMAIGTSLNALLNIPAILHLGIMGAAVVSSITYSIAGMAFLRRFVTENGLSLRDVLWITIPDVKSLRMLI